MKAPTRRRFHLSSIIIATFFLGVALGAISTLHIVRNARPPGPKPAYLVASWDIPEPDKLEPFAARAVPLAQRAGLETLAFSDPEVLEGQWPYRGVLIVQKYNSMEALRRFWNSSEHTAAKQLRKGYVDSHFVVGVESE
jgi:uncharacterized protein (DUF1330 family)